MKNSSNLPVKLAKPSQRALAAAGVTTIDHFTRFTEKEIAQLHGIGQNALKEIKQFMIEKGITFRPD